jgi:hypothetical protein
MIFFFQVDADRKRNTDVTATQEPSKDPLGSALKASVKQKSKNTSTDKIKKINLERISVEDDQSDLEEGIQRFFEKKFIDRLID